MRIEKTVIPAALRLGLRRLVGEHDGLHATCSSCLELLDSLIMKVIPPQQSSKEVLEGAQPSCMGWGL